MTQQRTVEVWGERYDLMVSQDANGLWVATGTYKRQKIDKLELGTPSPKLQSALPRG